MMTYICVCDSYDPKAARTLEAGVHHASMAGSEATSIKVNKPLVYLFK